MWRFWLLHLLAFILEGYILWSVFLKEIYPPKNPQETMLLAAPVFMMILSVLLSFVRFPFFLGEDKSKDTWENAFYGILDAHVTSAIITIAMVFLGSWVIWYLS